MGDPPPASARPPPPHPAVIAGCLIFFFYQNFSKKNRQIGDIRGATVRRMGGILGEVGEVSANCKTWPIER